ncbi:conserved hypothetical protein [Culex quinquefasciatus]|uniref:Uncharacterized protein n=1 Tax=Culex quinquefasciatus TaxID=7176 RepID=B0W4R9_CULQU|nr:conserved hypothetical protein [Culex quinquefasciatus]|eukprot:XP_001843703.1 conserved hypothetical protein [Culex quinquefasciatus]
MQMTTLVSSWRVVWCWYFCCWPAIDSRTTTSRGWRLVLVPLLLLLAELLRQAAPHGRFPLGFELAEFMPQAFSSVKISVKKPGSALIRSMLDDSRFTMSKHLEGSRRKTYGNDLDKRIDGLEDSLAAFKTECGSKIDRLADSVSGVRHGVPYQQNENLVAMFGFIVTRLGCDEIKIPLASLARLAKSPIAVGSTPPIICEFALRADRNDFYASYLNHRDLNLSHIGFQNTNRI